MFYVNVIYIDTGIMTLERERKMSEVVARIDDFGRPAWIASDGDRLHRVLAHRSRDPGLHHMEWTDGMLTEIRQHAGLARPGDDPLGSQARALGAAHAALGRIAVAAISARPATAHSTSIVSEALRKLEEEASQFREFLERLRMAKDRQEFDEFMADRRNRPSDPPPPAEPQGPAPQPQS